MENNYTSFKGKGPDAFSGIPEGYFDRLPDMLDRKISSRKSGRKRFFYTIAAVAAMLILFLTFGIIFMASPDTKSNQIALNQKNDSSKVKPFSVETIQIETHSSVPEVRTQLPEKALNITNQGDDSLTLDMISYEEIMEYLIVHSEYEF
ncbi:MAG: hypothetical protein Q8S18_00130 [Bacteroidales bacterium]|nr:hypothetical protein [Bacteroidales bacterium]